MQVVLDSDTAKAFHEITTKAQSTNFLRLPIPTITTDFHFNFLAAILNLFCFNSIMLRHNRE